MKKSFLLVLLGATMCCTAMADKKPSKKPAATTTKSQSAFTSGQEGLFGVLRRDADYFFDIPDPYSPDASWPRCVSLPHQQEQGNMAANL